LAFVVCYVRVCVVLKNIFPCTGRRNGNKARAQRDAELGAPTWFRWC